MRDANLGQIGLGAARMVPLPCGQAFFPTNLSYPVPSMGIVFRINHHHKMIVLGINASLVIPLANFCPMIIGKGSAKAIDS
jgi:hypothetical protein